MSGPEAHRLVRALAILSLLGACHSAASNVMATGGAAGTGGGGGSSVDPRDAAPDRADALASTDLPTATDVVPDSISTAPEGVSFPDPPQSPCATASDCEFPPSACADPGCDGGDCPGRGWVVYFDEPSCPAGLCLFERRFFQCNGLYQCATGGCRYNGTVVAVP